MKAALLLLFKNFGAALLTQHMIMFLLGLIAKLTNNKIDDNVIGLIDAGFANDVPAMKVYLEYLAEEIERELESKKVDVDSTGFPEPPIVKTE